MTDNFSHLNERGEANMVDVGSKPDQERIAKASGKIFLQPETLELIKSNSMKKGDIFSVARIAGIQAAKYTFSLIPLCHQLQLTKISVDFSVENDGIRTFSMVKCVGKTGVEMEALTAVNIALLTIYDMCKAVDKIMVMSEIKLVEKTKK
ncbi:MAG TPA: cyclic pyranopterin monophosphate synthase MoaC [Draconibacterium sp.]|nr:cyclic pyranopterin monophosphate synthase MoaC [Draconibacterium sp.]